MGFNNYNGYLCVGWWRGGLPCQTSKIKRAVNAPVFFNITQNIINNYCFQAEDPIKVEKSSDFDSLFSSSLPSDRKSKVKAEIDENRRSGSENRQGETENRRDGGRRKRKHEGEGGSAPRIKLKISLNKSPDKPDNTYKVDCLLFIGHR